MNNQPYPPRSLNSLEELLLRRAEASEAALNQLAGVMAEQLPATRPAVQSIVTVHQQNQAVANELAACLYLQQLAFPAADFQSASKLYTDGQPSVQALNAAIAPVFSILDGQPHPIALLPEALTQGLGDPQPLEGPLPLSWDTLKTLPDRFTDGTAVLYVSTTLASPTTQPVPTVIVQFDPADHQSYLVVIPGSYQWHLLTLDEDNEHYFLHHQAQFVQQDDPGKVASSFVMARLTDVVKAYFEERDNAVVTVSVSSAAIFAALEDRVELTVEKAGLYQFTVEAGGHEQLGKVVFIRSKASPYQAIVAESQPGKLLIRSGDQAQVVNLDNLAVVTQNLLLDCLTALMAKVKPAKPKTATA